MSANILHFRLEGTIIIIGLRLRLEYMVRQWASTQLLLSRDDISHLFIFLSAALHPISIPPAPLHFCHGSSLGNQCMYVSRHVNSPFLQADHFVFLSWTLDDMLRSLTWFLTYLLVLSTIFLISWKCINWTSDHLGAPSRLASLQRQKKTISWDPGGHQNIWHCYMLCFNRGGL